MNEHEAGSLDAAGVGLDSAHHRVESGVRPVTPGPGGEIVVKAIFNEQRLPGTQVLVHAPNGWDKELKTDADGIVSFTPAVARPVCLGDDSCRKDTGEFEGRPMRPCAIAALWRYR